MKTKTTVEHKDQPSTPKFQYGDFVTYTEHPGYVIIFQDDIGEGQFNGLILTIPDTVEDPSFMIGDIQDFDLDGLVHFEGTITIKVEKE